MGTTDMNEHAVRRISSRLRMESESTSSFTIHTILSSFSRIKVNKSRFISYCYFTECLHPEIQAEQLWSHQPASCFDGGSPRFLSLSNFIIPLIAPELKGCAQLGNSAISQHYFFRFLFRCL